MESLEHRFLERGFRAQITSEFFSPAVTLVLLRSISQEIRRVLHYAAEKTMGQQERKEERVFSALNSI